MKKYCVLTMAAICALATSAKTLHVSNLPGATSKYKTVAAALAAAADGDEIYLAMSSKSYGDFVIDKNISMMGVLKNGKPAVHAGSVKITAPNAFIIDIDCDELSNVASYDPADDMVLTADQLHITGGADETSAVVPEQIYQSAIVDVPPSFPGGDYELARFIATNLVYPEKAARNNIQGRVTVQFVVEKDGSLSDFKVIRGKDPDLDKEALRVLKGLPKFVPGKIGGKAVRCFHTIPINFKLAPQPQKENIQ